jgi:hypothetical protein
MTTHFTDPVIYCKFTVIMVNLLLFTVNLLTIPLSGLFGPRIRSDTRTYSAGYGLTHQIQSLQIFKEHSGTIINQGPKINIQGPKINIQGPKINFQGPKINIQGPKINIQGPKINIQGPKIRDQTSGTNIQGPTFREHSGNIPGTFREYIQQVL